MLTLTSTKQPPLLDLVRLRKPTAPLLPRFLRALRLNIKTPNPLSNLSKLKSLKIALQLSKNKVMVAYLMLTILLSRLKPKLKPKLQSPIKKSL